MADKRLNYTAEEINEILDKANTMELPTKISELINDNGYLTEIPSEYITEAELEEKKYLTEHQDISGKADKTELHNHSNKSVLDGITSDKVSEWDNKSEFSGNYNDLTNKPTIPSIEGLASEEYVDEEIKKIDVTNQLTDYAKKSDIPTIPTNISTFANDKGYLTEIPNEYVTETELNAKGYLTEHQSLDDYTTEDYVNQELTKVTSQLESKLNNFYGSENVGKILVVDENGYLVLDDMSVGTSYPVVGVVDENNVITLSSDKLEDGLYTLRYSNGDEYEEIGKLLVGEKIVTRITATKTKTSYDEGETLTTNDITVTAYYNDNTSSIITGYKVDSSSVNMSTKGSYQLKISYENCTTNITIIVNANVIIAGNLFVASTCTLNKRISSTGVVKDQDNTFLTDYIEIGKVMATGGENIIHWQGFHLYTITSAELEQAGVEPNSIGYRGVAYYDAAGTYLGQDSIYTTAKAYDSEGNYQLVLNAAYPTTTKIRVWGVTLPPATSVSELSNCKLTLNQLISEI